jgi:hypothetical protein
LPILRDGDRSAFGRRGQRLTGGLVRGRLRVDAAARRPEQEAAMSAIAVRIVSDYI